MKNMFLMVLAIANSSALFGFESTRVMPKGVGI